MSLSAIGRTGDVTNSILYYVNAKATTPSCHTGITPVVLAVWWRGKGERAGWCSLTFRWPTVLMSHCANANTSM